MSVVIHIEDSVNVLNPGITGSKMPEGRLSIEVKVSAGFLLVGAFVFAVSYAVDHWLESDLGNGTVKSTGLWKSCFSGVPPPDSDRCINIDDAPDWLGGVIAEESIALAGMLASLSLTTMLLFRRRKIASLGASASALIAGVMGLTGAITYHSKAENGDAGTRNHFGWALYVNIVGDVLIAVAGIGLTINTVRMMRGRAASYDLI